MSTVNEDRRVELARSIYDAKVPSKWDAHLKIGLRDGLLHYIRFGNRAVLVQFATSRFKPDSRAAAVEWLERIARSVDAQIPRPDADDNKP